MLHPVQLLDEAYLAARYYDLPAPVATDNQRNRQLALFAGLGIGLVIGLLIAGRKRKKR